MTLTLFTWGYWGWGNAVSRLLQAAGAVERRRGHERPFFADIRTQRSVRAACHHDAVAELVLAEAQGQNVAVAIEEWPGGDPCETGLVMPLKVLNAITQGRRSVAVTERFDLAALGGLPWASSVNLRSGNHVHRILSGPLRTQARAWVLPVLRSDLGALETRASLRLLPRSRPPKFRGSSRRHGRCAALGRGPPVRDPRSFQASSYFDSRKWTVICPSGTRASKILKTLAQFPPFQAARGRQTRK